ncbi:MAG TPA: hypothetical protein VMW54_14005 [Terriglobia bacterium]|nr:hypothetical protein [Terriglobia bacterium]
MQLFDDRARDSLRPKNESESTFDYYNQSARPSIVELREILESWFSRYPESAKKNLCTRFMSPKYYQHAGAFFEIYTHELLLRVGYEVDIEPAVGTMATRPDFLVKLGGQPRFLVEATLAGVPSEQKQGADARIGVVYDKLNGLDSPNFFLEIQREGTPTTTPPTRKLLSELSKWLASLDPDALQASYISGDYDKLPVYRWQHEGWDLVFTPIPKSPELRGKTGVRPIGIDFPGAEWLNTHRSICAAIDRKTKKYGQLAFPYVVAINVLEDSCNNIDIMNGLYGKETLAISVSSDGRVETRAAQRKRNGAWFGPNGPRNQQVSAVLIATQIHPWRMSRVTPELYHNPWAEYALPSSAFPLPQCIPDIEAGRVSHEPGQQAGNILGIPSPWPLPDAGGTNTGC